MVVTILLCSILLVMSCSKNDTDPITPPMASVPISAPASNDTLITVLGLRKWYFTRSPITNKFSSIDFVMYKQRDSRDVDIWIDSIYAGRQRWQGHYSYRLSRPIASQPVCIASSFLKQAMTPVSMPHAFHSVSRIV
jgi:hypothetical protein